MKDRARTAERIVDVQRQLHRIEELKYAQIQQKLAQAETDQLGAHAGACPRTKRCTGSSST